MEPFGQEILDLDERKVIQELICGLELAKPLRGHVFENSEKKGAQEECEALVDKVLDSFSNALSKVSSSSVHNCLKNSMTKVRPGRGQQKERRMREDSTAPINDGYSWRKYGQKKINHARHSRDYFRCSQMEDKKCEAKKQVQKIHDNPPVYRTTYFGVHICHNSFLDVSLYDADDICSSSNMIIRFEKPDGQNSLWPTPVKEELKPDAPSANQSAPSFVDGDIFFSDVLRTPELTSMPDLDLLDFIDFYI